MLGLGGPLVCIQAQAVGSGQVISSVSLVSNLRSITQLSSQTTKYKTETNKVLELYSPNPNVLDMYQSQMSTSVTYVSKGKVKPTRQWFAFPCPVDTAVTPQSLSLARTQRYVRTKLLTSEVNLKCPLEELQVVVCLRLSPHLSHQWQTKCSVQHNRGKW